MTQGLIPKQNRPQPFKKAAGLSFDIEAGTVKVVNPDDPSGRAWFVVNNCWFQYRGTAGYLLKMPFGEERYFSQAKDVVERVRRRGS